MQPYAKRAAKAAKSYLRQQWWKWTLIILPTAFVVAVLAGSPAYTACINEPAEQNAEQATTESSATIPDVVWSFALHRWTCSGDFVEVNHDSIIAAFTVLLVVVTGTLWLATEKLVKGAEDTAERQLRAYVLIDEARIENALIGKMPTAKITLKNFGQTPAYDTIQWATMGIDHYPPTLTFPVHDGQDRARANLGPGGKFLLYPELGAILTAEQFDALNRKEAALYVIGWVKYRDAFKIPRTTEFVLFSGGPIGMHGTMTPYDKGNDSD